MPGRRKQTKKAKKPARSSAKSPKEKELTPGQWFEKLVAVQARLRAPKGCPWDREQTHQSLRTYLLEEAYEVLEALDTGDDAKLAEEMRGIHDKMIRRHPHVFGDARAGNSAEVLRNWEQIKAEERRTSKEHGKRDSQGEPASLLDGVSRALPATLEGF